MAETNPVSNKGHDKKDWYINLVCQQRRKPTMN